jgi:hypothetical protein
VNKPTGKSYRAGGSIREDFNAAVNDQPARPGNREPGAVTAVHQLARGGRAHSDEAEDRALFERLMREHEHEHRARGGHVGPREYNKGWVEGQPAKAGGRLTAHERQHLPKGDFALPGHGKGPKGAGAGSYPIPDASHARNALARVSQHGSSAEKAAVRAKVHAKYPNIGKGG